MKRLFILSAVLCLSATSFAERPPPDVTSAKFEQALPSSHEVGIPDVVTFVADGEVIPAKEAPKPSIFLQITGALTDLVMTGVLALIAMLAAFLRSKAASDKAANIGLVITEAARAVVLELDATMKPKLKAFLADGVLDDVEKTELKSMAMAMLRLKLPAGVLKTAADVFGAAFLETYLGGKIEQAVAEKNAVQASAEVPRPA